MPRTKFNGVNLYWKRTGATGEPLVLVHGSWIDHHGWDGVIPSLSRSFRVVTYDRRGHSRSERATSRYSIRAEVADLVALIEGLDLAPAHVCGNSSGAMLALRLAAERPDLVRSLIVNEPPLMDLIAGDPDVQWMVDTLKQRIAAVVELLEGDDAEGAVRRFVETIAFGPGAWEQIPAEVRRTAIANAPTFRDEMTDPEFFSIDAARLAGFPRPALLTLGEQGPEIMKPIVRRLAAILPRARQMTFAGAGHEPEQTHPETFAAAVTGFLTTPDNPALAHPRHGGSHVTDQSAPHD